MRIDLPPRLAVVIPLVAQQGAQGQQTQLNRKYQPYVEKALGVMLIVFAILIDYPAQAGGLNTSVFKPMQDGVCEVLVGWELHGHCWPRLWCRVSFAVEGWILRWGRCVRGGSLGRLMTS